MPPTDPKDARAPAGCAIEKELGRGGMGVVYKARSLSLRRPCALKMILAGVHSGDADVERFKTEAQAIARLQHPGIVQVFEVGEHDGKPFMALEFCGGGSLDAVLAKNPLKPRDAAAMVRSLAEAMQAAHDANVVHRDLKPANVLLASPGWDSGKLTPKVTDFGLAKKLDEQGATRTGSVMGTPSYMPPEQAEGKKDVGPTVDVYSLGAILYECLTGRPPFRAATTLDTLMQVVSDEPVPLRQLSPQVPIDLETIAHKCLQKDPRKRYATAQDLADDLGRYLSDEPIKARPVGPVERAAKWVRRNAVVSALAGIVLLVLTAGVATASWFAYQAGEEAKAARAAEADAGEQKVRAEEQLRRAEWLVYSGKLSLAQSAFTEGNGVLALQHLEECQQDLREWEHRHLLTRFNSRQTYAGHHGAVVSVACSPDGKRVLSVDGATAKLWDAERGQEVRTLEGPMTCGAFSPDGKRALTGSDDSMARVWEAETGKELLALTGHTGPVRAVAFSPDGKRALTGSDDSMARVWEAETGEEILAIRGHTGPVTAVAFSPDGKRVLTGSWDNTARVWEPQTGQEAFALKGHTGRVIGVGFSLDAGRVLTRSEDMVKVWDAQQDNAWPLPSPADRKRFHGEQAAIAEQEKQWFAAAFHLGQLLLNDPDNAELKKRRETALTNHQGAQAADAHPRMDKLPPP